MISIRYKEDEFGTKVAKSRQCGSCTKCCEGWLSANVEGHEVKLGKPCYFLEISKGCTRYETRPAFPCKQFQCGWKRDLGVPDNFRPEVSGVIINFNNIHGYEYASLIQAPNDPSDEMIEWAIDFYVEKKKIGLAYKIDGKFKYFGEKRFIAEMRRHEAS